MIKNVAILEAFKKECIRSERANFYNNVKIVEELHKEAIKLGVFKRNFFKGIEEINLKIAEVVNSAGKTS